MMNFKTIYILFFICIGCTSEGDVERIASKDNHENIDEEEIDFTLETTAYDFESISLPELCYLDTAIIINDTVDCAYYLVLVLNSNQKVYSETYFQTSKNVIKSKIEHERAFVDSCNLEFERVVFDWKLSFYKMYASSELISVQYLIDTYSEGGNHHNYELFSITYDVNKQEELKVDAVLQLKTSQDTLEFLGLLTENQNVPDCEGVRFYNKRWDFNIVEEGIHFNPYSSWSCGLNFSFLSWDQIKESRFFKKSFVSSYH